ncbi:hypothetical protein [Alteribacillus sp. YIM 98480]|uniref:hypothetical protein n=1 Tax=Alteribacillus sp. YIM 98480 TaxID=2606599 RepID=UPI00131DCC55|nr:hypothetical protein [Alteribacillus sp. YIM 98480]
MYGDKDEYELFSDFALLAHYYHFSHEQIMNLPHSHFLAYIKQAHIKELQKSEEGREYLSKAYRYMNPRVDADINAIRSLTGYTSTKKGGE